MIPLETLQQHQQVCDELHALTVEENRFLQQHHRAPDGPLLERKRVLLERLEETLATLRAAPRGDAAGGTGRQALDRTRERILQILQLDRENEQLLLRFSLTGNRVSATTPALPAGMLQKIYQRHA
jgi:hypothetical protein